MGGGRMAYGSLIAAAQASVSFQIILGIFTGIATTVLLWCLKTIWERRIRPDLERMLYNGLKVDGPWHAQQIEDGKSAVQFTLNVQQTAGKIGGEGRIRLINASNEFDTPGRLLGELWEGYLAFTFRPYDRRSTAIMSGLVRVTEAGAVLHGYLSFREKTMEKVVTLEIAFFQGHPPPVDAVAFESALLSIRSIKATGGIAP